MNAKRSRNDINLKEKYNITQLLKDGLKQEKIAQLKGINKSTVSRVKKQQKEIEEAFEQGKLNIKAMRNKSFSMEKVDTALLEWFTSVGAGKPGLSGALLQEKAQSLAKQLMFDDSEVKKIDLNFLNSNFV